MDKKVDVILPMRAGSQRIVNKNVRPLNGIPLYKYIMNTLLDTKLVDKIVINTDIQKILDEYKNNSKIITIPRSENLRENVNMNWVIEDTINKTGGNHFLQLHATSPLLTKETIHDAIITYFKNLGLYDSLFSVTEKQMRYFDKNWKPINHKLTDAPTTQDLDVWYEENCILYLFSRNSFNKNKHRIGEKPYLYKTRLVESVDLDTEEEFKLAELLLRAKSLQHII